jgi:hypothetical protein
VRKPNHVESEESESFEDSKKHNHDELIRIQIAFEDETVDPFNISVALGAPILQIIRNASEFQPLHKSFDELRFGYDLFSCESHDSGKPKRQLDLHSIVHREHIKQDDRVLFARQDSIFADVVIEFAGKKIDLSVQLNAPVSVLLDQINETELADAIQAEPWYLVLVKNEQRGIPLSSDHVLAVYGVEGGSVIAVKLIPRWSSVVEQINPADDVALAELCNSVQCSVVLCDAYSSQLRLLRCSQSVSVRLRLLNQSFRFVF